MHVLALTKTSLRIALVIGSLARGGAEANLMMLARGLQSRGHAVGVFLLRSEGLGRAGLLREEGIQVTELRVPVLRPWYTLGGKAGVPAALLRTLREFRRFQPDILHAWLFEAEVWTFLAKELGASGLFLTTRQSLGCYKETSPWKQRFQNRYNRITRAVICNSRAVARDVIERERNIRRKQIAVIHSAVDSNNIERAVPANYVNEFSLEYQPDFIAVCVSNLFHYKGIADLIDAWGLVVSEHPLALLVVAGRDGGARKDALSRIRLNGLEKNVILAGQRADVPELLRGADLLVHPSHEEGFPSAVLEGMAAGLPVVATRVGGIPEAVCDGRTGILVPPRSPEEFAHSVLRIMTDRDRMRSMGTEGKRRARTRFTSRRVIGAHEALYRKLGA